MGSEQYAQLHDNTNTACVLRKRRHRPVLINNMCNILQ